MRINKALARVGVCSRRDADALIEQGRVMVDGKLAEKGQVVDPRTAHVMVARRGTEERVNLLKVLNKPRIWMHNKQRGVLVSASDPQGRPCLIPSLAKHLGVDHLVPVGRLDFASEGLILLTNDGDLAGRLMSSGIPRHYTLRVRGEVDESKLDDLKRGITVRGVDYKPLFARLAGGKQTGTNAWVNVTIKEGKNRELRNIFEFGLRCQVSRLVRVGFGPYRLPRSLVAGDTMEVENLFKRES